jgi:hypothetical protein
MESATWYKLTDESWGVKVRYDGQEGDQVTVTNKKGEEKTVWLAKRVAKFDDAQLWSVSDDKPITRRETQDEEPF